jgi:outer membrane protein assembly factor BamC
MGMKIRNIAVSVLSLLMLAACSVDRHRIDYRTSSAQVSPLEIPPDLTALIANDQYSIPGASGASVANYSEYSKGAAGVDAAVLPVLNNRHIERNGMQHWIVVDDKAENVWPGVKEFWLEMGFKIPVDNPQAGVMETDWLENHGNVPKSYVRQVQGNGKAIDILKSEGIRDQFVTRIERSKDGLSTEIHISSQVMKATLGANRNDIKWLPHQNDPEIEIAVLQMLMDKLGSEPGRTAPKAMPAIATALVPGAQAESLAALSVQWKESAAGKVIQINEPFDRSWRRVGLALDAAHIATTDKDRNSGIYFVQSMPDKDKRDAAQQSAYQVTVREIQNVSEVAVVDQNGKSDAETARITEVLYRSLGNSTHKGGRPSTGDSLGSPSGDAVRPSR